MATILLIDDSESHRAGIREVLQGMEKDLQVLEAEDGLKGLTLLMREAVDLVLCDLEMPKLDGEKLLRMRESSPGGAHIPFLFLSASTNLDRRAKLLANGASDAISKPYHPPELVARVRDQIGIPIGVGTIKVDVETATSDLAGGGEMEQTYTGVLFIAGGLRVGFGTGTRELSGGGVAVEDTQTNITGHYRIPMGKGGWVGPEIQMQTVEDDGSTEDEEITSIRWLMKGGF